jgi:hypothetical protein
MFRSLLAVIGISVALEAMLLDNKHTLRFDGEVNIGKWGQINKSVSSVNLQEYKNSCPVWFYGSFLPMGISETVPRFLLHVAAQQVPT